MAPRVFLRNLRDRPYSIDFRFYERAQVRALLPPNGRVEVFGIPVDHINSHEGLSELVDEGRLSIDVELPDTGGGNVQPWLGDTPVVVMDDAPDVTGSGTTQTVGFTVLDAQQKPVQALVQFIVRDNANLTGLASSAATLGAASAGTVVAGEGTSSLVVLTDANGRFECVLEDLIGNATHWLGCLQAPGGPTLDCTDIDSVTFS